MDQASKTFKTCINTFIKLLIFNSHKWKSFFVFTHFEYINEINIYYTKKYETLLHNNFVCDGRKPCEISIDQNKTSYKLLILSKRNGKKL